MSEPTIPRQGRSPRRAARRSAPTRPACGAKPLAFFLTFIFHGRAASVPSDLYSIRVKGKNGTTREAVPPENEEIPRRRSSRGAACCSLPRSATHWHLTIESILVEDTLKFFRVPGLC